MLAFVFASFLIQSLGLNARSINMAQIGSRELFKKPDLPISEELLIGSREPDTQRKPVCVHVTAIVPEYKVPDDIYLPAIWGLTFADYPTFWFYINKVRITDDSSTEFYEELTFKLIGGEEVLFEEKRKLRLSNNQPKIIKISVDGEKGKPLKIGEKYLWELSISCKSKKIIQFLRVSKPLEKIEDIADSNRVSGYISKAENNVQSNQVWYHVLNNSIDRICTSLNNPKENIKFRKVWTKLLKIIQLEDSISETLLEATCEEEYISQPLWSKPVSQ